MMPHTLAFPRKRPSSTPFVCDGGGRDLVCGECGPSEQHPASASSDGEMPHRHHHHCDKQHQHQQPSQCVASLDQNLAAAALLRLWPCAFQTPDTRPHRPPCTLSELSSSSVSALNTALPTAHPQRHTDGATAAAPSNGGGTVAGDTETDFIADSSRTCDTPTLMPPPLPSVALAQFTELSLGPAAEVPHRLPCVPGGPALLPAFSVIITLPLRANAYDTTHDNSRNGSDGVQRVLAGLIDPEDFNASGAVTPPQQGTISRRPAARQSKGPVTATTGPVRLPNAVPAYCPAVNNATPPHESVAVGGDGPLSGGTAFCWGHMTNSNIKTNNSSNSSRFFPNAPPPALPPDFPTGLPSCTVPAGARQRCLSGIASRSVSSILNPSGGGGIRSPHLSAPALPRHGGLSPSVSVAGSFLQVWDPQPPSPLAAPTTTPPMTTMTTTTTTTSPTDDCCGRLHRSRPLTFNPSTATTTSAAALAVSVQTEALAVDLLSLVGSSVMCLSPAFTVNQEDQQSTAEGVADRLSEPQPSWSASGRNDEYDEEGYSSVDGTAATATGLRCPPPPLSPPPQQQQMPVAFTAALPRHLPPVFATDVQRLAYYDLCRRRERPSRILLGLPQVAAITAIAPLALGATVASRRAASPLPTPAAPLPLPQLQPPHARTARRHVAHAVFRLLLLLPAKILLAALRYLAETASQWSRRLTA